MTKFLAITILLISSAAYSSQALAQMSEQPWGFKQQNRASIAALMQAVEDGNSNSSSSGLIAGSMGSTTLVCGSDGSSSAKGSSSCIILNNSDGSILLDQISDGDQNANSTETTNVDETINESGETSNVEDVLSALNGE